MLTHSKSVLVGSFPKRIESAMIEHAVGGDGVSVMAAAGRVGDDLLDGRAIQAERDVEPVVARAAAAAVLGDVDLALLGADVDEVAQVADALGGRGIGGSVGQGDAEGAGAVEDRRVADVEPGHALVGGGEDPADGRADDDVLAVDRVDGEIGAA